MLQWELLVRQIPDQVSFRMLAGHQPLYHARCTNNRSILSHNFFRWATLITCDCSTVFHSADGFLCLTFLFLSDEVFLCHDSIFWELDTAEEIYTNKTLHPMFPLPLSASLEPTSCALLARLEQFRANLDTVQNFLICRSQISKICGPRH